MNPSRRQFLKHSAKIFDLCVLACSFVFASIARSLPKGFTLEWLMALAHQSWELPTLRATSSHLAQSFCSLRTVRLEKNDRSAYRNA
jgi:hypothetical protein